MYCQNNFKNFKYMLDNWVKWERKSLIYLLICVPALVCQPILTAYMPKIIIDFIEQGASVRDLIWAIALFSCLVVLTTWIAPFMKELINGSARIIRMRYAVMAFKTNLNMSYSEIESQLGREKSAGAEEFYRSDFSGSAAFFDAFKQMLVCFVGIIMSLVLICKVNFFIILIIVSTCIAEFFLLKYLNKAECKTTEERYKIFAKFSYFYNQSKNFDATKDIEIYGFADVFIATMAKLIYSFECLVNVYSKQSCAKGSVRALLNLLRQLIAYAYLAYLLLNNQLSVADFVFYFGVVTGFSNWIINLVYWYAQLERTCVDCQRFRDFVENTSLDFSDDKCIDSVNSIEFKNVYFNYLKTDDFTIKNVSFKVTTGEKIAIVGENGAGKTTLVKLLCGLYKPTKGDILINGERKINYNLFSPVFQDYSFLPGTIGENITAMKEYDKKRLYDALDKAGMLEKIMSLNEKENTYMVKEVNNTAIDFSGGEKQKLLLAKAIYKDAPILILDEPTSALDSIAESDFYQKYNKLTKNKISFFISHRLSSTRFCDRIFFVSNGQIVESGTHEELMKARGQYFRMFQLQSYYYREDV